MANKRFLGLGFTFAATDKGLEKKLKGIKNTLQDIEESLSSISSSSNKAGQALGKMNVTSSSSSSSGGGQKSSRSGRHSAADVQARYERMFSKSTSGLFDTVSDLFEKMNKESQGSLKSLKESMESVFDKDNLRTWEKNLNGMRIALDNTGQISARSMKNILEMTKGWAETNDQMSHFLKNFNSFRKGLEIFRKYLSEVRGALGDFFDSIGVDFSKIIPSQFKAMFKVVDVAVLKPLKSIFSSLAESIFGKMQKSYQEKLTEKLLKTIGTKLGSNTTIQALLQSMLKAMEANKPEERKGFWKSLFGPILKVLSLVLIPFALLAGAIKGFKATSEFLRVGKLFSWLEKPLKPVVKLFEALGKKLGWLSKTITWVGEHLGAFSKFLEGAKFLGVFFKVGKFFGKWIAWPLLVADALWQIYKAARDATSVLDFLNKAFWNLADSFTLGASTLIKDSGKEVINKAGHWLGSFFKKKEEQLVKDTRPKAKVINMDNYRKKMDSSYESVKTTDPLSQQQKRKKFEDLLSRKGGYGYEAETSGSEGTKIRNLFNAQHEINRALNRATDFAKEAEGGKRFTSATEEDIKYENIVNPMGEETNKILKDVLQQQEKVGSLEKLIPYLKEQNDNLTKLLAATLSTTKQKVEIKVKKTPENMQVEALSVGTGN
jgi:hypothetical protein